MEGVYPEVRRGYPGRGPGTPSQAGPGGPRAGAPGGAGGAHFGGYLITLPVGTKIPPPGRGGPRDPPPRTPQMGPKTGSKIPPFSDPL